MNTTASPEQSLIHVSAVREEDVRLLNADRGRADVEPDGLITSSQGSWTFWGSSQGRALVVIHAIHLSTTTSWR